MDPLTLRVKSTENFCSAGYKSHKFYTANDFTDAEIARRNLIAVLVIEKGLSVCKQCGWSNEKVDWRSKL